MYRLTRQLNKGRVTLIFSSAVDDSYYSRNINNNMLFYEIDLSRRCSEFINHNLSWIICVTGDRQNITFSPGSGTQTASRFSSTSCRGSSYFSCCWPWWRPSLGRPPVPACRTSTGTPPIQCKSAPYFCFFFFRLFAPHLFRVIIFYHAGHWDCVSLDLREATIEKKIWG